MTKMHGNETACARGEYLWGPPGDPALGIVARGIANVPLLVCDPKTWREHPELFHYTGGPAFGSIVRSNSFWASHYRDMKDKAKTPHRVAACDRRPLRRDRRRLQDKPHCAPALEKGRRRPRYREGLRQ
jgi:hypothetical protein